MSLRAPRLSIAGHALLLALGAAATFPAATLAATPLAPAERCPAGLRILQVDSDPQSRCTHAWLKEVFSNALCTIKVISSSRLTVERKILGLREDRFDVLIEFTPTEQRRSFADFSKPYAAQRLYFYARPEDALRFETLRLCAPSSVPLRIIGPLQGWYGETWAMAKTGACSKTVSLYDDTPWQGVQMLMADRGNVLLALGDLSNIPALRISGEPPVRLGVAAENPLALMYNRRTVPKDLQQALDIAIRQQLKRVGPPCGLDRPDTEASAQY